MNRRHCLMSIRMLMLVSLLRIPFDFDFHHAAKRSNEIQAYSAYDTYTHTFKHLRIFVRNRKGLRASRTIHV